MDAPNPPIVKLTDTFHLVVGKKALIKCEIKSGNPQPKVKWFKDDKEILRGSGYILKESRKFARLKIKSVKESHAGTYTCQASNTLGTVVKSAQVIVRPSKLSSANPHMPSNFTQTTASDGLHAANFSIGGERVTSPPKHYVTCRSEWNGYCLHGGECLYARDLGEKFCRCQSNYIGSRCELFQFDIDPGQKREAIDFDRKVTMAGIIVGAVLLLILFVVAYCMARKRRKEFFQRQRRRERRQQQNGRTYTKVSTLDHVDGPVPVVDVAPLAAPHAQFSRSTSREHGTQTDEYNPLMALRETIIDGPGEAPYLDSPADDLPNVAVAVQHVDLTRPRLPAVSATPMVEPDRLLYPTTTTTTTNAVVEPPPDDPESQHSSPSQSSKTESAHGQPDPITPVDLPPITNGQAKPSAKALSTGPQEGNLSDYDNNPSDNEGQDLTFSADESPQRGLQDGEVSSDISDSDSSDGLEQEHFKELQKKRLINMKNKQDKSVPEANHKKTLPWETYGNTVPAFPTDPYYPSYADKGRRGPDRRPPPPSYSHAVRPSHRKANSPQV